MKKLVMLCLLLATVLNVHSACLLDPAKYQSVGERAETLLRNADACNVLTDLATHCRNRVRIEENIQRKSNFIAGAAGVGIFLAKFAHDARLVQPSHRYILSGLCWAISGSLLIRLVAKWLFARKTNNGDYDTLRQRYQDLQAEPGSLCGKLFLPKNNYKQAILAPDFVPFKAQLTNRGSLLRNMMKLSNLDGNDKASTYYHERVNKGIIESIRMWENKRKYDDNVFINACYCIKHFVVKRVSKNVVNFVSYAYPFVEASRALLM